MCMDARYLSNNLCDYIGRMELEVSDLSQDRRHEMFVESLNKIGSMPEGLLLPERAIARNYLQRRVKETQSSNMGCACGEAGEAD